MPRSRRVVLLASALLVVTGCVERTEPLPGVSTARTPTAQATARFPVTITRSGGVAGFDDHVSVQADGTVLARTRAAQVTCTLDAASLAALNAGALKVQDTDHPTPGTVVADGMEVLVSVGTGVVGIDDPKLGAAAPVAEQLLTDVSAPPAQRKVCH